MVLENTTGTWRAVIGACLLASMTGSPPAVAAMVDDFNDGNLDGWTTQTGTVSLMDGFMVGDNLSMATLDGWTGQQIGVDAVSSSNVNYTSLVLNFSSTSDCLFVKIQDNDDNGLFDRVFVYHGNNGEDGIVGSDYFDLSTQVAATYFEATVDPKGMISVLVGATGDVFGGSLTHSYTGTGIGLGFFNSGSGVWGADNFYVIPSPGALSVLALAGLAPRRRRRG